MEYLLKVSAIVAIFYLSYKIFLQRETFFEQNRWFLLMGLITAFLLPFLVIPIYVEATPIDFSNYVFETVPTAENIEKPFNILDYLPVAYGLGVLFFSVRFIIQFASLALVIFKNKAEKIGGFRYIKTAHKISPFSFFKWIVYNPEQFSSSELEQIITHEKVHAKQFHSLDILLTHLACIVLWFNPFIRLYNKDLKQNLEFIADNIAATKTDCKKSYQYTLLKTSMPSHQMALSNPFYNSLIKKRIVMLHKSKSKKINFIKYAFVMPLLAVFLMSFNTEEVYVEQQKPSAEASMEHDVVEVIISKEFTEADLENLQKELKHEGYTAKFKGIKRNNKNEITAIKIEVTSKSSNANYSIDGDEAISPIKISLNNNDISIGNGNMMKEKHVVIISDEEDDGEDKVVHSGPEKKVIVISSDDDDDSIVKEEIIIKNGDTIKHNKNSGNNLKTWKITVGKNAVSDTISFHPSNSQPSKKRVGLNWVSDEDKKVSFHTESKSKVKIVTSGDKEPLFIVDGKEITKDGMNSIDPNTIEKVEVIKDDNATRLYGDKGKDGVVLITTKRQKWETKFIVNKDFDSISRKLKARSTIPKNALYVVDGKETKIDGIKKGSKLEESIKDILILKGEEATKKYGDKGKNGVVEVTTKKK
ncbi:M56 family metallopeptidase [Mariniflexile sp. HNIBRBA6329]|uniref:M56 family metallopeptidase n=1 Tax=Mariniflexile sp. HNIBRBA6329 TaxID=3373088 RepID=UPI003745D184